MRGTHCLSKAKPDERMDTINAFVVEDSPVVRNSLIAAKGAHSDRSYRHGGRRVVSDSMDEGAFSRNYATPDMRRKCRGLGATQVFDKSNEIDALIAYCTRLASEQSLASRQHRWH